LLRRLLCKLAYQETGGLFTYSAIVADNDSAGSARPVIEQIQLDSPIRVTYCQEKEQNIACARNKALEQANGEFVAFIDDDEFPEKDWLLRLFMTCREQKVDGALGPVVPWFDKPPPQWLIRGRFYNRPRHKTGFIIDWGEGRTGNVLFRKEILGDSPEPFRVEFGSGGEDRDFFRRMIAAGRVFMWCDEAVVYEVVPPVRWRRSFMLRRALLRGKVSLTSAGFGPKKIVESLIAIPTYAVALPFLFLLGQHRFMKYLVKTCDHIGRLLACAGVDLVKEPYITE
jgi:cellulose synthase/poly-beta-1,6-N-acetylglucosamine synthase-like glycosyltransferase